MFSNSIQCLEFKSVLCKSHGTNTSPRLETTTTPAGRLLLTLGTNSSLPEREKHRFQQEATARHFN